MKRRDFFKNMAGVTAALAVAPILLTALRSNAEESRRKKTAASGADMISVKDPTAQGVQYVESSKVKGKNCANCTMYAKTGMNNGKEVGTCALFPKKHVYAKAYCISWAKKS